MSILLVLSFVAFVTWGITRRTPPHPLWENRAQTFAEHDRLIAAHTAVSQRRTDTPDSERAR